VGIIKKDDREDRNGKEHPIVSHSRFKIFAKKRRIGLNGNSKKIAIQASAVKKKACKIKKEKDTIEKINAYFNQIFIVLYF